MNLSRSHAPPRSREITLARGTSRCRETLELPGGPAVVEWRRSSRARRVSLRIDPTEGAVIVTLPLRVARRAGLTLLLGHADWVLQRLAALPDCIAFTDGATVPIGGLPHRICHTGVRGLVRVVGPVLEVSGDPAFLARRVRDYLRAEARRSLAEQARAIAAPSGLAARRVSVKDTRSRWGSCSADRALSFSWRLIMAPPFVQHYVVAHEVAHLRHMDHGAAFWGLVRALTPHEDEAKTWLHRHGPGLLRIG